MSRVLVTVISTLDGYAAGEGGDVFAMPIDLGFDRYNLARMQSADVLLFGATTFRAARKYWPTPAADPNAPEVERAISRMYATMRKMVISDSLETDETTPWTNTTEIVRRADATARLMQLRAADGGDVLCFGSFTTWNPLLAAGLVDELHILIGPGVIGAGLPTFTGAIERPLTLQGVDRVNESNLVALRYAVG